MVKKSSKNIYPIRQVRYMLVLCHLRTEQVAQGKGQKLKMTIDVYSKWLPNDDNLEINKLDI